MDLTIEDQYDRAAQYMREHGWHQGDYIDLSGAVCLLGALAYGNAEALGYAVTTVYGRTWVVDEDDYLNDHRPVVGILEAVIAERFVSEVPSTIATVNDSLVTTEAEAIGLLEKARARAGELGL